MKVIRDVRTMRVALTPVIVQEISLRKQISKYVVISSLMHVQRNSVESKHESLKTDINISSKSV